MLHIVHTCESIVTTSIYYLSNPYFTPMLFGEPLTNRSVSYIKVFGIRPSRDEDIDILYITATRSRDYRGANS
jgi:hypothetical protein